MSVNKINNLSVIIKNNDKYNEYTFSKDDISESLIKKDSFLSINLPYKTVDNQELELLLHFDIKDETESNKNNELFHIYSTIIEGLLDETYDDLILIADSAGTIMAVNQSCQNIIGKEANQIIGMTLQDLELRGITIPSAGLRVLNSRQKESLIQTTAKGKSLEVTACPVFDADGELIRIVCRSRDLSNIEKIKNRLDEMQKALLRYQNDLIKMKEAATQEDLIYESEAMRDILGIVHKVARVNSTVLIQGESGTGKEVIARIIHQLSFNNNKPFIKINCGAIPENLFESELFGYEPGAFTGAQKNGKPGLIELADDGTLFLDEIAEMPMNMQVKLLRVIQEREVTRLGGAKSRKVNVRIISATNRNITEMVQRNTFREDFYYRLNVIPIYIVPLREREKDIQKLTEFFLNKYNSQYGFEKKICPKVIDSFVNYSWPGNVRELENLIERLIVLTSKNIIEIEDLPSNFFLNESNLNNSNNEEELTISDGKIVTIKSGVMTLEEAIEKTEKELLKKVVNQGCSTREAAKILKVDQSTIVRKLKKYNITVDK